MEPGRAVLVGGLAQAHLYEALGLLLLLVDQAEVPQQMGQLRQHQLLERDPQALRASADGEDQAALGQTRPAPDLERRRAELPQGQGSEEAREALDGAADPGLDGGHRIRQLPGAVAGDQDHRDPTDPGVQP